MPTYKTSPYKTPLQTYLFRGTAVDNAGVANITGGVSRVYCISVHNGDGAVRYVSLLDSRAVGASNQSILFPVDANEDMTVFIDVGVMFGTAVTLTSSTNPDGTTGAPTAVNVNVMSAEATSGA